jgi:hypothetical protein
MLKLIVVLATVMSPAPKPKEMPACWSVTNYWPFRLYYVETGERVPDEEYYQNGFIHAPTVENLLPYVAGYSDLYVGHHDAIYEWKAVAFEGQADSQPNYTAAMHELHPVRDEWVLAAAPLPLLGEAAVFPWGRVELLDTFGNPAYQAGPIYHHIYERWVVPIDVLTYSPLHYLECDGTIE